MSASPESLNQKKGKHNSRKATMTSGSQSLLGRKLLLKASGASSLQERAIISHARIWSKREIKKHLTHEYMQKQLAIAHRQSL